MKALWSYLVCLAIGHVDELRIESTGMWLSCVRCDRETPGINVRVSRALRFQWRLFQDQQRRRAQA